MNKLKEWLHNLGKLIWDFVTDKNNDGDEKRFLGIAAILIGFYYGFQPAADVTILWAYLGFGGVLLGVSAFTDKIPRN